jgi:hypothetical protein
MLQFKYIDKDHVEGLFKEFMNTLNKDNFHAIVVYHTEQIRKQLEEDSL